MKTLKITNEIFDFTDSQSPSHITAHEYIVWWSDKTIEEEHMLSLSVEEIKATLLVAIFIFNENNELIAGAGIFVPRTWNDTEPTFNGQKVVELGTNYVLPEYRGIGIGEYLIEQRLKYAQENNWVPVSISSNEIVHKSFVKLNGVVMEENSMHSELRDILCLRCQDRENCKCCPCKDRCAWLF